MEDYNEYFAKGATLAQDALQKLANGDIDGFEHSWKAANDQFEMAHKSVDSEQGKISMLYGENRNFGVIMHVIAENLTPKSLGTKSGRAAWRSIIETVRKDPVLVAENKVYDALTNPTEVKNVKEYVDSALSLLDGYTVGQIRESNENLIKEIRNNGLDELIQIPDGSMTLYENIEDAITKRGVLSEVDNFVASRSYLVEHVKNGGELQGNIDESVLNDSEKELVEAVMKSDDGGAAMFEQCKERALRAIRAASDTAEGEAMIEGLKGVYERVENTQLNTENPAGSIAEMIEIKNTIED